MNFTVFETNESVSVARCVAVILTTAAEPND